MVAAEPSAPPAGPSPSLAGPGTSRGEAEETQLAPATPAPLLVLPELPPLPELPTLRSPDGRFVLTDAQLTVAGQTFGLRELERAEVQHVRWVLWVLLGALGLAAVLIAFLQNWLHTLPAAAGLVATTLLLAYGQRGTNRLRLWRLGPSPTHFALPGELAAWQRLVSELNRRVARAHDYAAAQAAALLAALAAAQAAEAAEATARAARTDAENTFSAPDLSL